MLSVLAMPHVQGLLLSPKMIQDHLPASLLCSLKAVMQRLAHQEGEPGNWDRQVATIDKQSSSRRSTQANNETVRLGSVFDLV